MYVKRTLLFSRFKNHSKVKGRSEARDTRICGKGQRDERHIEILAPEVERSPRDGPRQFRLWAFEWDAKFFGAFQWKARSQGPETRCAAAGRQAATHICAGGPLLQGPPSYGHILFGNKMT